jgi:CelD/BcsL family acetyltransferase involved in cellulose biosynthesis
MQAIETASEFAAPLVAEWDELASRAAASPFMRPGWIEPWWRAFGSGSLEIVILRRHGRLAGVLPLARHRGALVSTANWDSPEFAPVTDGDDALAELVQAALARTSVRLDLSLLDEASPSTEACARIARSAGHDVLIRPILRSPYLEIGGEWSAYEAALPSRRTAKYRRFRRRLDEQGDVMFELSDGSVGLAQHLREGFEVEAMGFEGRQQRGSAIVARPETARFYREVAEWAAARGWLRLWLLRVDARPIAFAYGLEHDGVYYDLKLGFDPSFSRFGPGVLLMRARLEYAFDASLKRFEFLGAAEPHKLDWTDSVRDRLRLQAFARTLRGQASRAAWERARPAVKRLLRRPTEPWVSRRGGQDGRSSPPTG